MGLLGILIGLVFLVLLAYRGWSVLLLAPAASMIAAGAAGEPLLAHWTQTFMRAAAQFLAQYFPLFLLGALGKLMDDSGSIAAIARYLQELRPGACGARRRHRRRGRDLWRGQLFVAFFVLVPLAIALFRAGDIPHRLIPAAIILGTATFTMSALPGTPAIQNAIPMPFLGTTPFAAPGLGLIASAIMLLFGLWWLGRAVAAARRAGEGYDAPVEGIAEAAGSASGGLSIALGAVGENFMRLAADYGIEPALMHRVSVIGAGTLDVLPHNGAVVSLLALCGATHRTSYLDLAVVAVGGALMALIAIIVLGSHFGAF